MEDYISVDQVVDTQRQAIAKLQEENTALKSEAEKNEIQHSKNIEKLKDKISVLETEIDSLQKKNSELLIEKRELKEQLKGSITDEDFFFLNACKADVALDLLYNSDNYTASREYGVSELVDFGIPKEFLEGSDGEGIETSLFELRETPDGNFFKIVKK